MPGPSAPHFQAEPQLLARVLNSLAQAPLPDAERPDVLQPLLELIDRLCPLHAFAIWARLGADGCCLLAPRALPAPLYEQLLVNPPHLRDHLAALHAADGWCKIPVRTGPLGWILARTDVAQRPLLQLLLTVLANRFGGLQSSRELARRPAQPPGWPGRLEHITRLLHQAQRLPPSRFWARLATALGDWLDNREMLLLQQDDEAPMRLAHPCQRLAPDTPSLLAWGEIPHGGEQDLHGRHWYRFPLFVQRRHVGSLLLAQPRPLAREARRLLGLLLPQLGLLLELEALRRQLALPGSTHAPATVPRRAPRAALRAGASGQALRQALANGRIQPYFQPVIHLPDHRWHAVEALARWLTEGGELRSACDFLPLAEQAGLVLELDRAMLRQVCSWLARLDPKGALRVILNLSGQHLHSRQRLAALLAIPQQAQVPLSRLVFEFRARELLAQSGRVQTQLHGLRARGAGISVDEVDAGFSALDLLIRLPVDYLKIDDRPSRHPSFSPREQALRRAVRSIADDLGMRLIVSGMERRDQQQSWLDMPCELAQGHLFGAPFSGAALLDQLHAGRHTLATAPDNRRH